MRNYTSIYLLIIATMLAACVSTKDYAQAEKDLCDCLSGIKAPADEFCQEWNQAVITEEEQLDIRMARLSNRNPEKYEVLLLQIALIKEERDSCLAKIGRYYGGN